MANVHDIPELDTAGLRKFGWTTGGIIAVLFGLGFPWLLSLAFPVWPWIIFGVLAAWGTIAPDTLRPVYTGWMRFGLLLSKITTPIVLGIVFYLVVTPMAFFMKLMGKDPMNRKLEAHDSSYRVPSTPPSKKNIGKPF